MASDNDCPAQTELYNLQAGLLNDAARDRLERHVNDCETCRALLVDGELFDVAVRQVALDATPTETIKRMTTQSETERAHDG